MPQKKQTPPSSHHRRKPSSKGHKSQRGIPEIYDQPKNKRANICLTQDGWDGLDWLCERLHLSRSEVIERIGRAAFNAQDGVEAASAQELVFQISPKSCQITTFQNLNKD